MSDLNKKKKGAIQDEVDDSLLQVSPLSINYNLKMLINVWLLIVNLLSF